MKSMRLSVEMIKWAMKPKRYLEDEFARRVIGECLIGGYIESKTCHGENGSFYEGFDFVGDWEEALINMENVTRDEPKGMLVDVFRGNFGDCTNGGFSSKFDRVLLVGVGIPKIFKSFDKPHVAVISDMYRGEIIKKCCEVGQPKGMFGGNFIYTSDSRFPSDSPIKIYDRYE